MSEDDFNEESTKKPDRRIVIEHKLKKETGDAIDGEFKKQYDDVVKQRDDYKQIVELSAEKAWRDDVQKFEDERDAFLDLAKDEQKRAEMSKTFEFEDGDPDSFESAKERLANAKIWSGFIEDAITQHGGTVTGGSLRPRGKASLPPSNNSGDADNFKQYIDELYEIKRDPSRSATEKQNADRMLDELFLEVIKGVNVARRRTGRGFADYQVNECPRCGALNQLPRGQNFERCAACGWTLYTRDAPVK